MSASPSLIILGCSHKKKKTSRKIAAIDRYEGPLFQVLHRHARERPEVRNATYVLSGRFGLIHADFPIPQYDHRLLKTDFLLLRSSVDRQVKEALDEFQPKVVFVSVGAQYWPLLDETLSREISSDNLIVAYGSIGGRASQFAHWLRSGEPRTNEIPIGQPCGEATLLGKTIRLSRSEIFHKANVARSIDPEGALRFQTWFVELGNTRVAPKWLASLLFDKPVSQFRAADARRALSLLGMECKYASR
jgi:hypothetical protein